MTAPRRAVYTAVTGRHDPLPEQSVAADSSCDFVCFTDDLDLRSDSWDVRVIAPALPLDPVRSARTIKLTGHPDLEQYDEILWIDARILLRSDPTDLLADWLAEDDLALPRHSFRKDVVTEFEEVMLAGLDDHSRLYEQLTHYSVIGPARLQQPVPATGMLARRRTATVAAGMNEWLVHVLRYSRRDQLSFVEAMARAGVSYRLIDLDIIGSDLHEWLSVETRSTRPAIFQVSDALQPPTARLGELQRQLELATRDLSAAVSHREQLLVGLEGEMADLRRQLDEARAGAATAVDLRGAQATLRRRVRRLKRRNAALEEEVASLRKRRGPGFRR